VGTSPVVDYKKPCRKAVGERREERKERRVESVRVSREWFEGELSGWRERGEWLRRSGATE